MAVTIDVDESSAGVGAVVVDSTDGLCSLREAIANANADDQSGSAECAAGSGADTIVLPARATFTLADAARVGGANGLPDIVSTITIQGNGSTITRDRGLTCNLNDNRTSEEFRIFFVDSGDDLTLEDLTVSNGCADGSLSRGGGIYTRGTLTVRRSTLSGNQASDGGGIYNDSNYPSSIESSTLSGNFASSWGGGLAQLFGPVTIRNSTFSGNSADYGGGVYVGQFGGMATLENVTFAANTSTSGDASRGGLAAYMVHAKNTIFDESGCSGSSPSLWNAYGANFDSGSSCSTRFGENFTANATLDLGPLADNGGPTETHALGANSQALDAVAATDCTRIDGTTAITTDQRGESRPLDGDGDGTALCDAGAFEVAPLSIDDVSLTEGDAGSSTFTFTLSRGSATVGDATAQVDTADLSAVAGTDYTAIAAQTATIVDGASSTTVDVTVSGDTVYELAESFNVNLTNATNGAITDGTGLGTITNDDAAPVFSVNDVTLAEGDSGTVAFTFTIAKTGATEVAATVDATSSDDTATLADNDYTALPLTTVSFAPAEAGKTVSVNINGDLVVENHETFNVNLANPSQATIGDNLGLGTITNDDIAGVTVSKTTATTSETGTTDSFTYVLDAQPSADVTVTVTSGDTTEGVLTDADETDLGSVTLTFTSANWNVPQTVTVAGVDDNLADGDQAYAIVTTDAVSTDAGYNGLNVPDVTVTNLDDETSANDGDGDGVDDVVEDGGPNGGDGNDDGIPDSTQPMVATFPAANGNGYITVMSTCELREVGGVLKETLEPTPLLFPYALVEFRLPCASADMTLLFHAGDGWDPAIGYWKYGPEEPGQALTMKWYELPGVTLDTTTVAGGEVARASFTLNDGELGDDTGVDGVIVDQGGPGASDPVNSIPIASEWTLLLLASVLATIGFWKLR